MFLTLHDTNLQSGMLGIGKLSLSHIQSGPIPTLKIPLVSGVSASRGIAPATFARNSTATYIEDGLVKTAGIDVPRFQNSRYLCEPAATNLVTYSDDMTSWGKISTTCVQQSIAGKTWYKVLANETRDIVISYSNSVDTTLGSYYTQSIDAKAGNTNFVSLTFSGGINSLLGYAIFDLVNGTIDTVVNCAATISEITDGEYRCSVTLAATATAKLPGVVVTPSRSGASMTAAVAGDYVYVNKAQFETGTQATSYIPTGSTSVTRAADELHYAVGDVITQGQGSLYCEFVSEVANTVSKLVLCITDGTNSNRIDVYVNTLNGIQLGIIRAGVGKYVSTVRYVGSGLNKVVITYEDNNYRLYFNGLTAGYSSDAIIVPDFNRLSVGCREAGTSQLNGEIGNVKYFKEVLTPAEAIKLTTL